MAEIKIPYVSHAAAVTEINANIRDEVAVGGVSLEDVSNPMAQIAGMVGAIVKRTAAGVVTYHAPATRTESDEDAELWFDELETLLEAAVGGKTYVLPPVIFKPDDAAVIALTATGVKIVGNGATVMHGASTPAGLLLSVADDTDVSGVRCSNGVGTYELCGVRAVRVIGTDTAATDTSAIEHAIEALNDVSGGTLYAEGEIAIDYANFSASASTYGSVVRFGTSTSPISLVGRGPDATIFKLTSCLLGWLPTTAGTVMYPASSLTGTPAQVGTPFNSQFAVTGHGLSVGDWVHIWSLNFADRLPVQHWNPDKRHLPGELLQVGQVVDVDNFVTEQPFIDPTTTIQIRPQVSMSGFVVKDFSVVNDDAAIGMKFYECRDFLVENVHFVDDPDTPGTAPHAGMVAMGCANFTFQHMSFCVTTNYGSSTNSCIALNGANTNGTFSDIRTETYRHHFDSAGIDETDITEGVPAWADSTAYAVYDPVTHGGTTYQVLVAHTSSTGVNEPPADTTNYAANPLDCRIGTARDILITNWKAQNYDVEAETSALSAINLHESGWNITLSDCIVNGRNCYAFSTRARRTRFVDCMATNDGNKGLGFFINGAHDCEIIGGSSHGGRWGVWCRGEDALIDGLHIVDTPVGVFLSSLAFGNLTQTGSRANIRNCVFKSSDVGIDISEPRPTAHILINDGIKDVIIENNSMSRGPNTSAVQIDTYVTGVNGTLESCVGNAMGGYGTVSGDSDAFTSATVSEASAESSIPAVDSVSAGEWQTSNYLVRADAYTLQYITAGTSVANAVDYSQLDWKLSGRACLKGALAATRTIFSQHGGTGTGNYWLWVSTNGEWYTKISGASVQFDEIPAAKVGRLYRFVMLWDDGAGNLTLTVNGVSQTVSTNHAAADGAFYVGSAWTGTGVNPWVGDLGVKFEQPVDTPIFTLPDIT